MSDKKTDYTEEALRRLLTTLKGDAQIDGLIGAFLDRCQELEDAAYPILEQRGIDTAEGHRLDRLGQIVGIPRGGRTDEPYRTRIKAEVAILNSDGTADDMMSILSLLLGVDTDTPDVSLDESFPKALTMRLRNHEHTYVFGEPYFSLDALMDDLLLVLQRGASAATEVALVYGTEASDEDIFRFSDTADTTETGVSHGTENGALSGGAS